MTWVRPSVQHAAHHRGRVCGRQFKPGAKPGLIIVGSFARQLDAQVPVGSLICKWLDKARDLDREVGCCARISVIRSAIARKRSRGRASKSARRFVVLMSARGRHVDAALAPKEYDHEQSNDDGLVHLPGRQGRGDGSGARRDGQGGQRRTGSRDLLLPPRPRKRLLVLRPDGRRGVDARPRPERGDAGGHVSVRTAGRGAAADDHHHPRRRPRPRPLMPQYLLSVFQEEGAEPASPEQAQMIMARVAAVQEEMKAAGAWVFFGALTDASSATVVRAADGEVSMTDGPYAEAKEQIGGFTVIEAADLDEALEWARKGSEACLWPVEVRPFLSSPAG